MPTTMTAPNSRMRGWMMPRCTSCAPTGASSVMTKAPGPSTSPASMARYP